MADPKNPSAAGALLALAVVAGALIGAIYSQPTIGTLAGFAVGVAITIVLWLRERRRIGK